ncbi:T-cell surface glycoprotein CD8 alpha chain [Megalops cyprinoides]|uniref:T-cell surface glycoprotein CD8 alpha chain n=1 Tax=Megalops cyprinoides TaxID=118141 RepID=UPI001863BD57|nr:T-cell surface glycoprotein CD8 alpha chain [Megalops cyprinoides]
MDTHQVANIEFAENSEVNLKCEPSRKGSLVLWFRVQETGVHFIASFTSSGQVKTTLDAPFDSKKIDNNILILKGFQKARDAGLYSCASINNNALHFGKATRIEGLSEPKPTVKATTKKAPTKAADTVLKCTREPCQCEERTNTYSKYFLTGLQSGIIYYRTMIDMHKGAITATAVGSKPFISTCHAHTHVHGCTCMHRHIRPHAHIHVHTHTHFHIYFSETTASCSWIIWTPVAGGCGLLFIILIIIICYCNRMRKRRCPHHYKRRPKSQARVRQASPDRYV